VHGQNPAGVCTPNKQSKAIQALILLCLALVCALQGSQDLRAGQRRPNHHSGLGNGPQGLHQHSQAIPGVTSVPL